MRSKIFLVDSILNNCYFECPDHSTSSSETFAQQTWKINCALLMLPLFFIITLIRNNGLSWLNQLIANQRRSAGRSVKSSGKKNLERGKAILSPISFTTAYFAGEWFGTKSPFSGIQTTWWTKYYIHMNTVPKVCNILHYVMFRMPYWWQNFVENP